MKPSLDSPVAGEMRAGDSPVIRPVWMALLGLLAVISLILQHGFVFGTEFNVWFHAFDLSLVVAFGAALVIRIALARRWQEALTRRRFEVILFASFLTTAALACLLPETALSALLQFLHQSGRTDLLLALMKFFLLANVGIQALRALQRIFVSGARLELVLAGSFVALILIGMLLLLLPRAAADPNAPISLMDAFFTATSAACVTGLAVRDTGMHFSTAGQMVILGIFQIGGLGIVTFVAFISAFSSRTLPVPQMVAFRQIINAPAVGDLKRRIAGILLLTALIEGAGMVALYLAMPGGGDPMNRLTWSLFHSVSAFCNAGFGLHFDSLESVRSDVAVNSIIMFLIVLGGLGFLVLPELIARAAATLRRIRRRFGPGATGPFTPPPPRLTLQSRISLIITFWMIVIGFVGFWLLESDNVLSGRGIGESGLISMFQSVTTRTAGFNSVPIGELTQATLMLMIMLMIVGGSPVSTAGGIKTVTFGILFLALRSMIFRREKVEAHGRTLPARAFFTALNVFVLYAATATTGVFLISVFDPNVPLRDTLFETVSALSTVGLSTGITASLSDGSKLVLCAAMFIGRVGPIALVFSVFQARGKVDYEFPTEDVVVG